MRELNGGGVRRHFNYSNVMSTLAVFLVIAGGTAVAASIDGADLEKRSVKNNKLVGDTVKSNKLKDDQAVADADVIPDALTGRVIAAGAIGTGELGDNSVSTTKLQDAAVTTDKIADAAVNSTKIADGQVRAADLGPTQLVANTENVAATSNGTVSVACPAGTRVLNGGHTAGSFLVFNVSSFQSGNGWIVAARNTGGAASTITAVAICLEA